MNKSLQKPVTTIIATGLNFPEGPVFDLDGNLWCVELKGGNLVRINGKNIERFPTNGKPNGAVVDAENNIVFCDAGQNAIRKFMLQSGEMITLADEVQEEALNKPNDLAYDAAGNLVFTCPGESRQEPTGYVCVLTKKGDVKKIAETLYFPNGLAFSEEGDTLIIAETYRHRLWKGRWDAHHCAWIESAPWAVAGGPIGPDGMAYDNEDNLYVAVFGTGAIRKINSKGEIVQQWEVPGSRPTNCAFDPSGRWGLVVTEAEKGQLLSIMLDALGVTLFKGKNLCV